MPHVGVSPADEEDRKVITLTLPYPVSANRYWRSFTNPKTRRTITVVSPEAKSYKSEVGWLAKQAGIRQPLLGRIALSYTLHPKRPQDWERRQRKDPSGWEDTVQCMDLDNAQKVLLDALKCIVFADDGWVRRIVAERGEPRETPCVVVHIEVMQSGLFAAA